MIKNLLQLDSAFKEIFFYEEGHTYKIGNNVPGNSVSRIIKRYETPFDVDKISRIVAKNQGVPVEEVRQLWDFKRDYSCEKGTLVHSYIENYFLRKKCPLDKNVIRNFIRKYPDYLDEETFYKDVANHVNNFLHFFEWFKEEHIILRSEFVIGDVESRICGTLDNLSFNLKDESLIIFDYKTNKDMESKSKESMTGMLSHLPNTSLVKYSLQLHLYSHIIERNSDLKIKNSNIVWIGGDKYELIPTLDLRKEVEQIIQTEIDLVPTKDKY
jgi:ATP-dependent exoDNAse (exonuclease V) beta subunit